MRDSIFTLSALLLCLSQAFGQETSIQSNWAGNSFPGVNKVVVPSECARFTVAPNGAILTNCYWDETHNNASIWKDGKFIARADFMVHSGYHGGDGVTASTFLAMISQNYDGKGSGKNKPPVGMGVSFRSMNLNPIQIPGGKGGGEQRVQKGSYLSISKMFGIDDIEALPITSSRAGEQFILHVCDRAGNLVRRYLVEVVARGNNLQVSRLEEIEGFAVSQPMSIAFDSDDNAWIGTATKPAKIVVFGKDGKKQDREIPLQRRASDLAIHGNELWVANETSPVPIYNIKGDISQPSRHFGKSIRDVTPAGALTNELVTPPRAIGFDQAGNVYTLSTQARTTYIASYNSSGNLKWRLHSNAFAVSGGITPDGNSIYTGRARLEFDGKRWDAVAVTYDPETYPDDPRRQNEDVDSVRAIERDGYLFVYIFFRGGIGIYRKESDSEILRPVGFLNFNQQTGKYFENQPEGRFLWIDVSGDSKPQDVEFWVLGRDWGQWIQGYHVDSSGSLTFGLHDKGVARAVFKEVINGVPRYSFKSWKPAAPSNIVRALYDSANDRLIVSGFDSSIQRQDGRVAGNKMFAYKITDDQLQQLWEVNLKHGALSDQPQGIESITIPANGKLIFAGDRMTCDILVYDAQTGKHTTTVTWNEKLYGSQRSALDVVDAVDVAQLKPGTFRIVVESSWVQNLSVYDLQFNGP